MRLFNRGVYYSPDNGGGGSGEGTGVADTTSATVSGGGNGTAGNQSGERREADIEQRLAQAFTNLAMRQGGQDAAGILLLQENRDYRDQIRRLEQQVRDLQTQLPADDAAVLSADDATRWQAYQELGGPDEIRQEREQYHELGSPDEIRQEREQHQLLQRRQTLNEAAVAVGFKGPVLEHLADGLTVELREEQQDGMMKRIPYVVLGEGDAVPLTEYAPQNWADFLPALVMERAGSEVNGQSRTFVQQTPAGKSTSKDLAQQFLDEQRERESERKNPLMR